MQKGWITWRDTKKQLATQPSQDVILRPRTTIGPFSLATNSASSIASIVYIAQSSALLTTTAPSSQKNHAHRLR